MMDTIHNRISSSITADLVEPKFFTDVVADLITEPALIEPVTSNAALLTQLQFKASVTGSNMVLWWDIGLPEGELIGIETYKNSPYPVLVYTNQTETGSGVLTFWNADSNGKNSSYPLSKGDASSISFNMTARPWYRVAARQNSTVWTDIYEGRGSRGNKLMIASVTSVMSQGSIKAVVAHGVSLDIAQQVVKEQLPSNRSRLALTTGTGTVVALTGEDNLPTDEFNDKVVTKKLSEMEDPVWKCLTNNPDFNEESDAIRIHCQIQKTRHEFHVNKTTIEPAPGVKWVLWSVLCMDDFVGDMETVLHSGLVYTIVITCMIWLLFIFGSMMMRWYISSMQSRILEREPVNVQAHHMKQSGVLLALQEMRKVRRSHAGNEIVRTEIDSVIDSLKSSYHDVYYDIDSLYKDVTNSTVRDALINLYGKSNSSITSKIYGNISPQHMRLAPVFGSPTLNMEVPERLIPLNTSADLMLNRTVLVLSQCNMRSGIFQSNEFQLVIEATLRQVDEQRRLYIVDAIDFISVILKKLEPILSEPDVEMALYITMLAWQLYMKDRCLPEQSRINRFFITDSRDFKTAVKGLILSLYAYRTQESESNDRWSTISQIAMDLAETAAISKHHSVISQFTLIPKTFKETGRYTYHQIVTLMRMLFNLSMISFLFHKEDIRSAFLRILNPDYPAFQEEVDNYVKCIFEELVDPALSALRSVMETEILIRMIMQL